MSIEIDRIIRERNLKDSTEALHKKLAMLMEKKPEGIQFDNMDNELLQWWIDKSLEWEFYLLTGILKEEQDKRKQLPAITPAPAPIIKKEKKVKPRKLWHN